jgi:DNA-binding LacI/PurR family transcriptional regulator
MAERRVRLRDVAERAGVSIGSASQAFGRPELVSAGVRERVLAAAKELGYAGPDPAGRRLRTGRAGALGLIFTERLGYAFTDPAAPAFLRGVAWGMEEAGTGLLIIPTSPSRDAAATAVHEAAVDGFIIYSAPRDDPRVEAAVARRLPLVTVDQPRGAATPFIGIDDRAAARTAAEHIRALGHERVGVISFPTAADPEGTLVFDISEERLAGYREGLAEAWDEDAVLTSEHNAPEPARALALELLSRPRRPTAILAMTDALAIGVLQAAAELGLAVPQELSVVGFDDAPAAAMAAPPLTTVAQPHEEKGRLASEWLIGEIAGRGRRRRRPRTLLPTELVVRESTAPVR